MPAAAPAAADLQQRAAHTPRTRAGPPAGGAGANPTARQRMPAKGAAVSGNAANFDMDSARGVQTEQAFEFHAGDNVQVRSFAKAKAHACKIVAHRRYDLSELRVLRL